MMRNLSCTLGAALLVSVLAAACGGDGGTKKVVGTVGRNSNTPAAITGNGSIDLVVASALRADDIALAGLTGYEHVACKTGVAEDPGGAPACREGEKDGTQVEILASSGCTNSWVRPEQVPDAYRFALAPDKPVLISVIKPRLGAGVYGAGFNAEAAVVFRTRTNADGRPGGVALHVTNGRVSWIESSCANLDELTAPDRVEAVIFDPKSPAAASSPAASGTAAETTPRAAQ